MRKLLQLTLWKRKLLLLPCLLLAVSLFAVKAAAQENIEDSRIRNAIENELLISEEVSSHLINVSVSEGVVTLSGEVDNLLAKEKAIDLAEITKGVRSVVDRIEIAESGRSDQEIQSEVETALVMDPAADSYEITVEVNNGNVTLEGSVSSWAEKNLAETVVKNVRGVRSVNNDISIDYDDVRTDYEIKTDVQRRLETDVRVDDGLIVVSVEDGRVKLEGTVGSAAEKSRAETDAWVNGVTSVDASELDIKWWARDDMKRTATEVMSDSEIKQAVQDALLYDPRVFSFNPTVTVEDGVVTLTGEVESLSAKIAAENVAMDTIGVWSVNNYLRVRPVDRPSDSVLADRVRNSIGRDPYLDRGEIDVSVLNGKVYLSGVVSSVFEKERAGDTASYVAGVIEVDNNIIAKGEVGWKTGIELKKDVESELYWSPFVDADQVTVDVSGSTVILTGTVDSWHERRTAVQNALEAGAKNVTNHLEVDLYPETYWTW